MLEEHKILQLPSSDGRVLEIEVNWDREKKFHGAKRIKIKAEGEEYNVLTDDLVSILMAIGSSDQIKKLLPIQRTRIRSKKFLYGWYLQSFNKL